MAACYADWKLERVLDEMMSRYEALAARVSGLSETDLAVEQVYRWAKGEVGAHWDVYWLAQ